MAAGMMQSILPPQYIESGTDDAYVRTESQTKLTADIVFQDVQQDHCIVSGSRVFMNMFQVAHALDRDLYKRIRSSLSVYAHH
jgi:hypothetical protein